MRLIKNACFKSSNRCSQWNNPQRRDIQRGRGCVRLWNTTDGERWVKHQSSDRDESESTSQHLSVGNDSGSETSTKQKLVVPLLHLCWEGFTRISAVLYQWCTCFPIQIWYLQSAVFRSVRKKLSFLILQHTWGQNNSHEKRHSYLVEVKWNCRKRWF